MNARCVCEKCGKVNIVGSDRLKRIDVQAEGEEKKTYVLTYYECLCGHENVVQADDIKTRKILKQLNALIFRVMRQGATNRDRNRKNKAEADLIKERARIREEIRGKNLFSEEKIFKKGLTFADECNII